MNLFQFLVLLLICGAMSHLRKQPSALASSVSSAAATSPMDCPSSCQETLADTVRIAYLILVHNNRTLHDAVHLVKAIRHARNLILVHVDKKMMNESTLVLEQLEVDCPCSRHFRIESVYDVKWSHWSMNEPTLWGMKMAVTEYAGQWDVFINLSGDTLPVYTVSRTGAILKDLPYNFVTSSSCETGLVPTNVYLFPSWWHKRAHYTLEDTESDPVFRHTVNGEVKETTLVTHFGSQWIILQESACRWLVEQLEDEQSLASQFRDYLIESGKLMTDETFIPTLIIHMLNETLPKVNEDGYLLWKNGTASDILDVRYERMDEHVPTAFGHFWRDQRYQVPVSLSVEQPRPWGPYFLGAYDFWSIRQSGALFVRKVSVEVEPNIVELLPVNDKEEIPPIRWPNEVAISEKVDWMKRKEELVEKRRQTLQSDAVEGMEDDEEEL